MLLNLHPWVIWRPPHQLAGVGMIEEAQAAAIEAANEYAEAPAEVTVDDLRAHAEAAMEEANYEVAIRLWADLRERLPYDSGVYTRSVVALRKAGRLVEADHLVEHSFHQLPRTYELMVTHADTAMDMRDFEAAAIRCERLRKTFPHRPAGYIRGAKALAAQRRFDEATELSSVIALKNLAAGVKDETPRQAVIREVLNRDRHRSHRLANGERSYRLRYPGEPIRVAFLMNSIAQREHLLPIYDEMFARPDFDPFIVSFYGHDQVEETLPFFQGLYPEADGHKVYGSSKKKDLPILYDLDPDVVFLQRLYVGEFPEDYQPPFLSAFARVAYTSYGMCLNLGSTRTSVYANSNSQHFWRYFAEGPTHADAFRMGASEKALAPIGSPKVDLFRKAVAARAPSDKKTVLWNSHLGCTTFVTYYDVMKRIAQHEGARLVFRPHPFLRQWLSKREIMTKDEFDERVAELVALGAEFSDARAGDSYIPHLMSADLFVSDFSSLTLEHSFTGNPCIYLSDETQDASWLGSFGREFVQEACYPVANIGELDAAVDMVLMDGNDPKVDARKAFADKHKIFPKYSVAAMICENIKQGIND